MESILLHHTSKGWNAEFLVDGKPDTTVSRLLGTNILPTPYTHLANPHTVLANIRLNNPGIDVRLANVVE